MASLANLQLLETRPLPNNHFNATEVDAVLRDIFLKHRHVANKTILEKYNQKEYGNSESDYNEKETQRFVNLFQDVSESCSDSIEKKESEEKRKTCYNKTVCVLVVVTPRFNIFFFFFKILIQKLLMEYVEFNRLLCGLSTSGRLKPLLPPPPTYSR